MNNNNKITVANKEPLEAIILAGGFGTRLRSAVADTPKPMAPIGSRPFLEFLMDYWLGQGVSRFILSVGYLAERVMEHFGAAYREAAVEYVKEDEPLGTGGAIALALKNVKWRGRRVLILNGDTWLTASLSLLLAAADKEDLPVCMVLTHVSKNNRYGGVEMDERGRVRRFGVPPTGAPALINAGCYLFDLEKVGKIISDFPARFSLESDFLEPLARAGQIGACPQSADFIDIGIVDDYKLFCRRIAAE